MNCPLCKKKITYNGLFRVECESLAGTCPNGTGVAAPKSYMNRWMMHTPSGDLFQVISEGIERDVTILGMKHTEGWGTTAVFPFDKDYWEFIDELKH